MNSKDINLAEGFDNADLSSWQNLAQKSVGGRPLDQIMSRKIADKLYAHGFESAETAQIYQGGNMRSGRWDICTPHWSADAKQVNGDILADLEGGATSVTLRMEAGLFHGLKPEDFSAVFNGVFLDMAGVRFMSGEKFMEVGNAYLDYLTDRQITGATGTLGADPIGTLAQNGRLLHSLEGALSAAAQLAARTAEAQPGLSAFLADGGPFHSAGADTVQELATILSSGLAYLRAMEAEGIPLDIAATQIELRFAADADQFVTLAKARALRRMWANILSACGVKETPGRVLSKIVAQMSLRMLTVKDPWVNILRATTAALASGLGGADAVIVMPHDTLFGVTDTFARRLSRNIHIILQEESHIGDVSDPAAGSYYLETLTYKISEAAWSKFQTYEKSGSAMALLLSGALGEEINATYAAELNEIAVRKRPITGISEYADLDEAPLQGERRRYPIRTDLPEAGITIERLPIKRYAEVFEYFRMKSDRILEATNNRPCAVIITLGKTADCTPRLSFIKNSLAAIGIDTRTVKNHKQPETVPVKNNVCTIFCGNDAGYLDYKKQMLDVIKNQDATNCPFFVVGKPESLDELKLDGMKDGLHKQTNLLLLADELYKQFGEGA